MSATSIRLIGAASGLGGPDTHSGEGPERLRARLAARGKLRGGLTWHRTVRARHTSSTAFPPPGFAPFSRELARTVRGVAAGQPLLWLRAEADLDGDGVLSRFERTASERDGRLVLDEPLIVHDRVE